MTAGDRPAEYAIGTDLGPEAAVDPTAGRAYDQTAGPVFDPPAGPAFDPAAGPVGNPVTEAGGDPGTAPVADPAAESEAVLPAPAVRPFLLTSGRVAGADSLVPPIPVEAQVVATREGMAALDTFAFEHRDIVAVCQEPQSVAEIAAKLRLHLNVIRVLADDLRADGQLALYLPHGSTARDASVLRRVIDGLRAVPDSREALRDR